MTDFDLDAILGEDKPKTLQLKGVTYTLPGELPGSALSPFLREDLGLAEIIADLIKVAEAEDDAAKDENSPAGDESDESWMSTLIDKLIERPNLPLQLVGAARDALAELLEAGEEGQADRFFAQRPSVNAYAALAARIPVKYGMDIADFFFSSASSAGDGEQSKPTSPGATPGSTPEESGETPAAAA